MRMCALLCVTTAHAVRLANFNQRICRRFYSEALVAHCSRDNSERHAKTEGSSSFDSVPRISNHSGVQQEDRTSNGHIKGSHVNSESRFRGMNRPPPKTPKANDESMSGTGTRGASRSSKEEEESLVRPEQPSGLSHRRFVDTNSSMNSGAIPFPTETTSSSANSQLDNNHGNILETLPSFLQPVLEWPQVGQPVEWHIGIPPESNSVLRKTPIYRQRQKERLRPSPPSPPPGCVKRVARCPECKKQKKVHLFMLY
jgi:hypothetical protein